MFRRIELIERVSIHLNGMNLRVAMRMVLDGDRRRVAHHLSHGRREPRRRALLGQAIRGDSLRIPTRTINFLRRHYEEKECILNEHSRGGRRGRNGQSLGSGSCKMFKGTLLLSSEHWWRTTKLRMTPGLTAAQLKLIDHRDIIPFEPGCALILRVGAP